MMAAGKDVINLAIGNPSLPPSSSVITELHLQSADSTNHGYQPYKGVPELSQEMSNWMHRIYGQHFDPSSEILPLIGSKEGIMHISLAFLDEGDKVLVPELAYPAYAAAANMVKAKAIRFPLLEEENWEPDWEYLYGLDCTDVKLLWINYPNMPTGKPASKELFKKFVAFAKEKQVLLCHDNPYSLILNDNPLSIFNVEGAREVALELQSMSKSHNMAGWRFGWVCGNADYLDLILRVKSNFDSGQFKPAQKAAVSALKLDYEWFALNNLVYRECEQLASELLNALGCTSFQKQVGMFKWAKIPSHFSDAAGFTDWLLEEKHIFLTPGFVFGEKGNSYARISLSSPKELYSKALERVVGQKV